MTAPEPITITVQNDTFDVEITVAPPAAGGRVSGLDCEQVSVRRRPGGPPVTGIALRQVPVATLIRKARRAAGVDAGGPVLTEQEAELARLRGPVDSTLRTTAAIYKAAAVAGDPPLRAVETTLGLPRSTAGRWVSLARDRGLLDHPGVGRW